MKLIPFFLQYLRYFKFYSLLLQIPIIIHYSSQIMSSTSGFTEFVQPSTPPKSPSSQSPAPSQFTPLSAITLHLPLQFSHPPAMANGVTPILFSAAGGLSDGPLSPHPASQARMAGEANMASRVRLLEEWMDRLERQANQPASEQNAMEVQVETTSTTTAEPVKKCHRCKSKRHLVADCPKRRWCRPGSKPSHQAARRRQEQEEASILWDQQWSITNTEDWSDETAELEALYKRYPWMRPCQKCKGIGYVLWVELETGAKKAHLCDHKEEPSWGSGDSDSSAAW